MALTTSQKAMTVGQGVILKDHLEGEITEVDGKVDAVGGKVTTLVGSDTDKSARSIANEELAKQLIPENAKESLDTLQEIAGWIQQHPDDASAMNSAISANTSAIEAINNADTGIAKVAKDYADSLDTAMNARVEELENKAAGIEIVDDDDFYEALGIPKPSNEP